MSGARAAGIADNAGGSGVFDREVVDTLERNLVEHVGPIARYLVQSAARQAGDVDALCATLAANIERPSDRAKFTRDVRARLQTIASGTSSHSLSSTWALSAAEADQLQIALTRYLGPVARVLIKRALPRSASKPALWRDLATHIEHDHDRAAFLRAGPSQSE